MTAALVLCSGLLLLLAAPGTKAQFPWVCTGNATLENATCCPSLPSDPTGPACGGAARGLCSKLSGPLIPQVEQLVDELQDDDRLEWPLRFFQFGCVCKGNFWGYACHRCKPGWTGSDCSKRQIGIRRNIFSLSRKERRLFQDVLARAKTEPSDMAVLNISGHRNGDPVDALPAPIPFFNVSVYDFLIYMHVYAARSTLLADVMKKCLDRFETYLDFAHRGPGFGPWHRYYLVLAEAELTEIARKYFNATEPFTLPYWDWVDEKSCTVCTNDLIGATNQSDPNFRLDRSVPFAHWRGFCDMSQGFDVCHVCDPQKPQPHLWRTPSKKYNTLPVQDDIDYLMSLTTYDNPPYDDKSNASSFRTVLEGFVDKRNNLNDTAEERFHLHNLVHSFMNGTWFDVATSPNDPLFWLHHSFVDKLFELWIRLRKGDASSLPVKTRPGHGRFDPMVPFFPPVLLGDYMADSRSLGYDYDNTKAGTFDLKKEMTIDDGKDTFWNFKTSTIIEGAVIGLLLIALLVLAVVAWRRPRSLRSPAKGNANNDDETTPLVDDSGRPTRQN